MTSRGLLIALFVGAIAVLGFILWRNAQIAASANDQQTKTFILVAAVPLRTGTLLRADDVKWQGWTEKVPTDAIVRPNSEELKAKPNADAKILVNVYGAVLRQRVESGEPVLSTAVVKPGDRGFLAAVLAPGHRAITIGVTAVSGAAGLVFPGDHVDLILTQVFANNQEPLSRRAVGETIARNLRVLAIDEKLQQPTPEPTETGPVAGRSISQPEYNPHGAHSVTLEVLPKQAEIIDVAANLGTLSLTLRGVPGESEPSVDDGIRPSSTTWADDVSPALRASEKPKPSRGVPDPGLQIYRGSKVENVKQ